MAMPSFVVLLYLLAALLLLVFSTRFAAYALQKFLPLFLESAWGRVQLKMRLLSLLRLQGLGLQFLQEGVVKGIEVQDVCLFREAEWYQTFIRWIFEGTFPVGIRGLHLSLKLKPLLSGRREEKPTISKTVKTRRRIKLTPAPWVWRLLFRMLSRILINVENVQITVEDVALRVRLQHLAVRFKCERDVPCRAALKAQSLEAVLLEGGEGQNCSMQFFELSKVEATASLAGGRKRHPEMQSAKVALGKIAIVTNQRLIEEAMELAKLLPKAATTPRPKSPKKESKLLSRLVPQKIGGGIIKLTVTFQAGPGQNALDSVLELNHLHTAGQLSKATEKFDVEAGITEISIRGGGVSDSAQAIHLTLPNFLVTGRLEKRPASERLHLDGRVELASGLRASIDDALVWSFCRSVRETLNSLVPAPAIDVPSLAGVPEGETLPRVTSSGSETQAEWKEESENDSVDLELLNRKKYLDSGDLGFLEEVENEDVVKEPPSEEDFRRVQQKPSLLIKAARLDWDLALVAREGLECRLLQGRDGVDLILLKTDRFKSRIHLKSTHQHSCACAFSATLGSAGVKVMSHEASPAKMDEIFQLKKFSCSVEGSLTLRTSPLFSAKQASLCLAPCVKLKDAKISMGCATLDRLLTIGTGVYEKMRQHCPAILRRRPARAFPRSQKPKAVVMELEKWSAGVTSLQVEYETLIHPIEQHSKAEMGPVECTVMLDFAGLAAASQSRLSDCQLKVNSVAAGWKSLEQTVSLLNILQFEALVQKQNLTLGLELRGSEVHLKAEVDAAVVALQLVHDVTSVRARAQRLLCIETPQTVVGSVQKSPRPVPSSKHVAVRVPSSARLSMQHISLLVEIQELTVDAHVAESDVLQLCVSEVLILSENSNPDVRIGRVALDMNKERVMECVNTRLRVKGPCFLSELNRPSANKSGRNKNVISAKNVPVSPKSCEAEMPSTESDVGGSLLMRQRWRMMGCSSMGITENVEEEFAGADNILDFYSICIETDRASIILPHDQNIGRLVFFAELWTEAVKDLSKTKVLEILGTAGRAGQGKTQSAALKEGPADLIEVCISAKQVVFRLDAHPMEAWLSQHGHPLREAVILRHVWEGLIRNLQDDFEGASQVAAARDWASADVSADYFKNCRKLQTQQEDPLYHHGAWMSVTAENVDGLILVGDRKSPSIIQATIARIKELDHPSSDDVTFARVQSIYIAARATDITGHFNGVEKPSAVIGEVDFSGLIARGRQMTHNPKTYEEIYTVGRWHEVQKELPLKGARPPMKTYTDMEVRVTKLDANGGIGLEPVFCELSKAFNRLIPPSQVNSDGSLPSFSSHTLQSWDKIRYTWRGKMSVQISQLTAAVAANTSTSADIQTPRIELQAEQLDADVVAGGIHVKAVNLEATLFDAGLRSAPEAPLRDLQLFMWPHASMKILYTWLMPQGRSALLHHAFPVVQKADPSVLLDPVDLFDLFVGEGYTLEIHADFDRDRTDADPVSKIFMGEAQIRFLIRFFQLMENAPTRIRGCWKKGTYFAKKDKRKKCITPELPNLLHRIVTSLKTSKLAVEHHVWEAEDPSDQLLVTCDDVRFNGTWAFLNKIEDANALREGRYVKTPRYREVDGIWRYVKGKSQMPDMEDLAVSAQNVEGFIPEVHSIHPILTRDVPDEVHSDLMALLSSGTSVAETEDELKPPGGVRGRILTAKTFKLKQQSPRLRRSLTSSAPDELQVTMPNGEIKRPLRIQLVDVKVIMPLEVRNAVVGVYMHMLSAFTGPPRSAALKEKITDSIPPEQLQERRAQEAEISLLKSSDSKLLELLLQQDQEGLGRMRDAGRRPSVEEQQKVDPLPCGSKIILQLEFDNVQLSCLSSVSMGGVLVCLQSGVLHEAFSEEEQIRTMTLQLNQVQAYHMDTKIDPMNPIRWLDRVDGALVIPADSHGILTRIVQPFEAELSDLHLMMLAQARNPGRAAEELKIHSSRIEARTDSDEFEMLVDVINSLATPPPPDIKLMRDTILGPTGSALEDTSEAISEAKEALREAYRGFNDLRQQVYELSLISAPDLELHVSVDQISRVKAVEFLKASPLSGEETIGCRKHILFVQTVLEEQIEVARKICAQCSCTLQEISRHVALTNKHKKLYKSMKMQIGIDKVTWGLIKRDTEFMRAEIKRFLFKSFQNKDLSGESSVSVYRIEMRDSLNAVGPGSGLDSGVVLSVLEPSGSDEEVLRGLAIRGAQTQTHVYYDHIEAWVHRFGLNFNEQIATELAGFFFPSADEEVVRKREEDWAKFADPRRESEFETEPTDKSKEKDFVPGTLELRPRASSFLEPLITAPFPERNDRFTLTNVPVASPESDPLQQSGSLTRSGTKKRRKKGLVKPRKILFVHVRFNKIVTHMTYAGRPFSFKGLTITLGMSEYNRLEGSWRGLFKKYRNGVIGSVIKSIATHEGRSYDPSFTVLGESSREEKGQSSRFFGRGARLFRKKEKTTPVPSDDEDEEMKVDVIDEKSEQAGRDLLLGKM